jgi:glutamate-ammonia-ligase adenylyltransferase
MQVAHAHRVPALRSPTTRLACQALADAGLLDGEEAALLVRADRLWRAILAHLRLTVGRWPETTLPEPVAAGMLAALRPLLHDAVVDQSGLRAQMQDVAEEVRTLFLRRLGPLE